MADRPMIVRYRIYISDTDTGENHVEEAQYWPDVEARVDELDRAGHFTWTVFNSSYERVDV